MLFSFPISRYINLLASIGIFLQAVTAFSKLLLSRSHKSVSLMPVKSLTVMQETFIPKAAAADSLEFIIEFATALSVLT